MVHSGSGSGGGGGGGCERLYTGVPSMNANAYRQSLVRAVWAVGSGSGSSGERDGCVQTCPRIQYTT